MNLRGNLYSRIATVFMIITIAVIGFIVHITLATATIHVPAKEENFVVEAPIQIAKEAGAETLYGETVSVDLEQQQIFPVSGKLVTSDLAVITVTLHNTTAKAQPLVKTTRLMSSDGKIFRLTDSVTVPANGTVGTTALADKPGQDYQIPAGKFTIPGLATSLQDQIYGQTDKPSSFERPEALTLSATDIDQARSALLETMKKAAVQQLKAKLTSSLDLIPEHIAATVMSEQTDPALGTKTQQFTYQVKATFTTMVFDHDQLVTMAKAKLKDKLPSNASLVQIKTDSFAYSLSDFATSTASASAKVHLEATIATTEVGKDLINPSAVAGKTPDEARDYFQQQGLPGVSITLSPFWVRHIPRLTDHIKIELGK